MYNVILSVAYLGKNYRGYQYQPDLPTIEGELIKAILPLNHHTRPELTCSGRTDSIVNALSQKVNFITNVDRKAEVWMAALNATLPIDIRINFVHIIQDLNFNARFSAISRSYRYHILNSKVHNPLLTDLVTHYYKPLDIDLMLDAAKYLLGEQDFSCFRGPSCESKSPVRNIHAINIIRENYMIYIDITANAFLHNMVRNIVGTLMMVGNKSKPAAWCFDVVKSKNRNMAGPTAKACGLTFISPHYKEEYSFLNDDIKLQLLRL